MKALARNFIPMTLWLTWAFEPMACAFTTEGTVKYDSRYAYHVTEPRDLASHRHRLELSQKWGFGSRWQWVMSGRGFAEGAFAANTRYQGEVARLASQEVRLRDFYLQYKGENLQLRLGNQQVVWGEAFGFYYADIVNPKDLREFGLGDLESQRLPTPIVNLKWLNKNYSVQLIYLPKPYLHQVPPQGSDFAFPFVRYFPGAALTVNTQESLPLVPENYEAGIRATALIAGTDLSLFFLSYFDRMPSYTIEVTNPTPLALTLTPSHPRIRTTGFTLTRDFDLFLIRLEAIYTQDRLFAASEANTLVNHPSDEFTSVVGVDLTQFEKWRVGVQLSVNYVTKDIPGLLQERTRESVSLSLNGPLWKDHTADVLLSYLPHDGSSLARFSYLVPLSSQLEMAVGTDLLFGGSQSEFGQYHNASRAYALLKGTFSL